MSGNYSVFPGKIFKCLDSRKNLQIPGTILALSRNSFVRVVTPRKRKSKFISDIGTCTITLHKVGFASNLLYFPLLLNNSLVCLACSFIHSFIHSFIIYICLYLQVGVVFRDLVDLSVLRTILIVRPSLWHTGLCEHDWALPEIVPDHSNCRK